MGSPAQSRSRAAQSMFSPLSVTREREKTDEGEAQTETEAPERPQSKTFSLLESVTRHERRQREEGEGQSQPEEPREDRGGRCPDGSSGEAPESDFYLITRNRRQRERKEGARASQRSPGGQRRERLRRKLRRGPGVGWDWFSNSFPLVFLSKPIRKPKKTLKNQRGPLKT